MFQSSETDVADPSIPQGRTVKETDILRQLLTEPSTGSIRFIGEGEQDRSLEEIERAKRHWERKYEPPVPNIQRNANYRSLCQDFRDLVDQISGDDEAENIEALESILAEIFQTLSNLYECQYGSDESLKEIVIAVKSQLTNVDIDRRHCDFLKDFSKFLNSQYLIDDTAVADVLELIEEHHLDPYRGVLSDEGIKKRYRLVTDEEI